jgi:hypothetical protein
MKHVPSSMTRYMWLQASEFLRREKCDGKLLFQSLRSEEHVRGDFLRLNRKIAGEMRVRTTETWSSLDSLLRDLVSGGAH